MRLALLVALTGLAVFASSAHAAKRGCTSGGAKTVLLEGKASVVSLDTKDATTFYGCWVPSGKRFKLGTNSWDESLWDIVDGRFIGVYRYLSGGEGDLSADARSWDAKTGKLRYKFGSCSSAPYSAVFYAGGGIAYRCGDDSAHAIDDQGERVLDTNATDLAVSPKGDRLFWINGETPKSVTV
jgi:hypothetical protein